MRSALAVLAAAVVAAALPPAASPAVVAGIYDEAETLFAGNPVAGFQTLARLNAKVLRLNLYWDRVAPTEPADATDPADPAYDWSLYDRAARLAEQRGIRLLLSILSTPAWANGGEGGLHAPDDMWELQEFAQAAARRYSGRFTPPEAAVPAGLGRVAATPLPRVELWLAWNEPNNPRFLRPQSRRINGRWRATSPQIYAEMCNAVVTGVHAGEQIMSVSRGRVACGAMAPRGNNVLRGSRPSISPIRFLREMRAAGARPDVVAHHAYATSRFESPTTRPPTRNAVTLGNIGTLLKELRRLYPGKRLWITEYGYQTNPPDRLFGVPWATQARWLKQAYRIASRKGRIEMLLWFLIKDERDVGRWQSGLISADGTRKPAFNAFRQIAR